jgi:metallo-beta-lactamase family protein
MSEKETLTVQFLGAAGTVTGSKFLIECAGKRILIDCGLFQGKKELRKMNWSSVPFDASTLDCVLLTHGHLDHVGYLPLLVRQGFRGPVFATWPTIDIARLILFDCAKIQEEDAKRANKYGYSKHHPALPLYTAKDVEAALTLFRSQPVDEWIGIDSDISFRMQYNGHILGSVFIELRIGGKTLVFSGDLGRPNDPLLYAPRKPVHADVVFIEATYGNKIHETNPKQLLTDAINRAITKKGIILIPSFAVERTQLIMYYVSKLMDENLVPRLPVYMDSPMAAYVMEVFVRHNGWHRLTTTDFVRIHQDIRVVDKPEETDRIIDDHAPKIVIAAAGMASGGRILTYFDRFIEDPRTTVLLVGHQAEGTRGRAMLDGAAHIKLHGFFLDVEADIVQVEGLSAHADSTELTDWLSDLARPPEKIFIVHAEKDGAEGLQTSLKKTYGYSSTIPQLNEWHTLRIPVRESLRI